MVIKFPIYLSRRHFDFISLKRIKKKIITIRTRNTFTSPGTVQLHQNIFGENSTITNASSGRYRLSTFLCRIVREPTVKRAAIKRPKKR